MSDSALTPSRVFETATRCVGNGDCNSLLAELDAGGFGKAIMSFRPGNISYASFRGSGISLMFFNDALWMVIFYGGENPSVKRGVFRPYEGELTAGIHFGDHRNMVNGKIAARLNGWKRRNIELHLPEELKHECTTDSYLIRNISTRFTYHGNAEILTAVTLSSLGDAGC